MLQFNQNNFEYNFEDIKNKLENKNYQVNITTYPHIALTISEDSSLFNLKDNSEYNECKLIEYQNDINKLRLKGYEKIKSILSNFPTDLNELMRIDSDYSTKLYTGELSRGNNIIYLEVGFSIIVGNLSIDKLKDLLNEVYNLHDFRFESNLKISIKTYDGKTCQIF